MRGTRSLQSFGLQPFHQLPVSASLSNGHLKSLLGFAATRDASQRLGSKPPACPNEKHRGGWLSGGKIPGVAEANSLCLSQSTPLELVPVKIRFIQELHLLSLAL